MATTSPSHDTFCSSSFFSSILSSYMPLCYSGVRTGDSNSLFSSLSLCSTGEGFSSGFSSGFLTGLISSGLASSSCGFSSGFLTGLISSGLASSSCGFSSTSVLIISYTGCDSA